MTSDTLALVGAAGGAGTTRLTLECATLLARDGRDVAVLDAAYATQGLADYTPGRIDPDMTTACVDDVPIRDALVDRDIEAAGRLAVCPARAPFERLARAKTPEAAEAFERRVAEATRAFDHILVDTPPIAANQAVAAVNVADRVAIVCDDGRAADALPRLRDRLEDVGAPADATVVTRTTDHPDADATVPDFDASTPAVTTNETAREAVAEVLETALGVDIERDETDGLRESLPF
ncbi:ParA family protein [Natronomonas amylolytica]|uniref:ParA family protein n=1 Tax=Natronomonas amylolytica TaxID=3108498 RepID=UPI00300AC9C2